MLNKLRKQDNYYTPTDAVELILPYLKPNAVIWCPFDTKDSNFVKVLTKAGHTVIHTHYDPENNIGINFLDDNQTKDMFFKIYDYVISNPPFSLKGAVLKKLYQLDIPFALIMPFHFVASVTGWNYFRANKLSLLIPEKRIYFIDENGKQERPPFHSCYFTYGIQKTQIEWV